MKVTTDRLRELFHYDKTSGIFTRAISTRKCRAGEIATGTISHGYIVMSVDSKLYAAHRLAWLWVTGEWPKMDIDHIDGNRKNNKFANLRDVDRSTNLQNLRAAKSHNKSTGLLGVHKSPITGRYTTRIQVRGKDQHIGSFGTAQEAHQAYLSAKRELHQGCTL